MWKLNQESFLFQGRLFPFKSSSYGVIKDLGITLAVTDLSFNNASSHSADVYSATYAHSHKIKKKQYVQEVGEIKST